MNLSFLKKLEPTLVKDLPVVESVVSPFLGKYGPVLTQVVSLAGNAIQNISSMPPSATTDVKTEVLKVLDTASPAIEALLSQQGIQVTDAPKFVASAGTLIDSLIGMLNGLGMPVNAPVNVTPSTPIQSTGSFPVTGKLTINSDGSSTLTINWPTANVLNA